MDMVNQIKKLILSNLDFDIENINIEVPADSKNGDYSSNVVLENFKNLSNGAYSNPRAFAIALCEKMNSSKPEWLGKVEAAGPGFVNFYVKSSFLSQNILKKAIENDFKLYSNDHKVKYIVEHTSVNPNKAMHIGHIRNAFIGDMIARILRKFDYNVEVHNYIDDTGLQVADTTLALMALDKVQPTDQSFADFCWDIYSEINRLYETDPHLKERREEISRGIEKGEGEIFDKSQAVVTKIVGDHLELMRHLGISYDLLVFESDIIKSGFWATAFEKLKKSENFYLETEGKQAGCWVLKYKDDKFGNKIFVRTNGTVVYTGKDLAYHMWKFGVLGKDFGYLLSRFGGISVERTVAQSQDRSADVSYGSADAIVTVVDERQEYPQEMVRYGLEALGYQKEYSNYKHLAYAVVNLSLNTAKDLGLNTDEGKDSYAMSGRKGIGVKAKDLIVLLENKIKERTPDADYQKIAAGAIKHYMLKYNTMTEIVFDYETALNLKGNTGPYLQYSYARAFNILSKALGGQDLNPVYEVHDQNIESLELVKLMGEWPAVLEKVSKDFMLSYVADYAFKVSSAFHKFYETNNVLKAEEPVKSYRLTVVKSYLNTIKDVLSVMGIETLEKM